MKKILTYTCVMFLLTLHSTSIMAQIELEINGSITSLLKDKAIVKGYVPNSSTCQDIVRTEIKEINGRKARVGVTGSEYKGLFLGVSVVINYADGWEEEIDFDAKIVKGSFRESYELPSTKVLNATSIKWTARLWHGRVFPQACKEWSDNGSACKYCKNNGYHMWSPVERADW